MTDPALFALIRDGETTHFVDPGGAFCFPRNLVWGPDALEGWLAMREPVQEFDTDCQAGAVIDFDAKALLWYTEEELSDHPRAIEMLDALIARAWEGFEILYADCMADLQIAAGDSISHATAKRLRELDRGLDPLESRGEVLEEGHPMAGEFDPDDEDQRFAWVTIQDEQNLIHHRLIGEITADLIHNQDDPLTRLKSLEPVDVPAERNLTEAIFIDEVSREIQLWGGRDVAAIVKEMHAAWPQWSVCSIAAGGYAHQCRLSGPTGTPMSAAQALGSVVPMLLLTEQLDAEMVLGEIGKSVRGCMAKGVTLITILFCVPFAVFALISGNWKTGAISIGIVVVGVWIAFKLVELRLRRGFKAGLAEVRQETQSNAPGEQAVAGPTEPRQRRDQLNRLLNRAGMPCVADIEPHFVPRFPGVA